MRDTRTINLWGSNTSQPSSTDPKSAQWNSSWAGHHQILDILSEIWFKGIAYNEAYFIERQQFHQISSSCPIDMTQINLSQINLILFLYAWASFGELHTNCSAFDHFRFRIRRRFRTYLARAGGGSRAGLRFTICDWTWARWGLRRDRRRWWRTLAARTSCGRGCVSGPASPGSRAASSLHNHKASINHNKSISEILTSLELVQLFTKWNILKLRNAFSLMYQRHHRATRG